MIIYYAGSDGPTVLVESAEDLHEILDLLHTQCLDNLTGDDQDIAMRILEEAMDALERAGVSP